MRFLLFSNCILYAMDTQFLYVQIWKYLHTWKWNKNISDESKISFSGFVYQSFNSKICAGKASFAERLRFQLRLQHHQQMGTIALYCTIHIHGQKISEISEETISIAQWEWTCHWHCSVQSACIGFWGQVFKPDLNSSGRKGLVICYWGLWCMPWSELFVGLFVSVWLAVAKYVPVTTLTVKT